MAKKKNKKTERPLSARIMLATRVFFLLMLVVCIIGVWVYHSYQTFLGTPIKIEGSERILQIPAGSSAGTIAEMLTREGIIEHEWMMRYAFMQSEYSTRLQAGTVVLTPGMTPGDLPEVIAHVGKYARRSVQILAGMNLYEIAERLQSERIADKKSFLALALDPRRAATAGIPGASYEGFIGTGAYTFEPGIDTDEVLSAMYSRWTSQWQRLTDEHRGAYEIALKRLGNDYAIVTLASIIEKEAVKDREMPVISRVFTNRMRKGMKLQSDPTCIYPPREVGEKPTPERCKDKMNPYSTYVIPALPPGPISTPSPSSLLAAILPYTGPDASAILYFVARQDGSWTHYFSKTYAEHQAAVDYFLRGKKQKKPSGTTQPFE